MFIEFLEILVWDYLWGVPLVAVVLTAGVLFTVRSGFFSVQISGIFAEECLEKAV